MEGQMAGINEILETLPVCDTGIKPNKILKNIINKCMSDKGVPFPYPMSLYVYMTDVSVVMRIK